MDCGLAMIIKQRAKANDIERMDLVGSVNGCDCIIGLFLFLVNSISKFIMIAQLMIWLTLLVLYAKLLKC